MNLLLLLSALLSALTGIGGSVRAPDMAQAVAGASAVAAVAPARRPGVAARPAFVLPGRLSQAILPRYVALALPAAQPIWATRRRE